MLQGIYSSGSMLIVDRTHEFSSFDFSIKNITAIYIFHSDSNWEELQDWNEEQGQRKNAHSPSGSGRKERVSYQDFYFS